MNFVNQENRKIPCSAVILTLNSAKILEKCLSSLQEMAEIVILDGNSTDNTVEIAKKFGAKVYPQVEDVVDRNIKIEDFTEVRLRGLSLASYDWIINIDSDEWFSEGLISEIRTAVMQNDIYNIYQAPDVIVLDDGLGPIVKHAWSYPHYSMLRLYNRKGDTQLKGGKKVHERWVKGHKTREIFLRNPVFFSYRPYQEYQEKVTYYLSLAFSEYREQGVNFKRYLQYVLFDNFKKTVAILYRLLMTYLKDGFKETLPFKYSWQSLRYQVILIWLGTKVFFSKKK